MAIREVRASGPEYLTLASALLQRARLADPVRGMWEAADVQWWWRRPRASDAVERPFWVDGEGPVAGLVLADWGRVWVCDPVAVSTVARSVVLASALEVVDATGLEHVEVLTHDDDRELIGLLADAGFAATGETSATRWLRAEDRPGVVAPPDGFTLVDRVGATSPHPMRSRNGDAVEARLRECSLYDPSLDLAVVAPGGEVAGYALFWFDPVTAVGLVEPMRVEDAYQRRGLARTLLTSGVDRLAERGAQRIKVGHSTEVAGALYAGAGFQLGSRDITFRRVAR